MADSTTRVSIPALQDAISTYQQKRDALKMAYMSINDEVTKAHSTWTGDAANKFVEQFAQMYRNLSETDVQMEGAITKLNKVMEEYEAVESRARSLMESAQEGTTPTVFG
ncbi:MAG: WXG100 family type VII secretion target [Clostridia bacterium]|nr:WXG100 family type VII secretion target [Clostridia bacterium]